jgi:hypothetical protein
VNAPHQAAAPASEHEERGSETVGTLRAARVPAVIWGHPLGSHTHSWIHYGFARAFEHLGFDVLWLEDSAESVDRVSDLERAIVLTEGQQDEHLPAALRPSWLVFGHNCEPTSYRAAADFIPVQVLMLDKSGYRNPRWHPEVAHREPEAPSEGGSDDAGARVLEILWATDLLPHEIEFAPHRTDTRDVVHVGSVWGYNRSALKAFRRAVRSRGLKWKTYKDVDQESHERLIREARFAPSIQGDWQVDHGYMPCRLFKNISYSQLAVSNNPSARLILDDDLLICDRDPGALVDGMLEAEQDGRIDEMVRGAQATVRSRHTYVNRINELLGFAATEHPDAVAALLAGPTRR